MRKIGNTTNINFITYFFAVGYWLTWFSKIYRWLNNITNILFQSFLDSDILAFDNNQLDCSALHAENSFLDNLLLTCQGTTLRGETELYKKKKK